MSAELNHRRRSAGPPVETGVAVVLALLVLWVSWRFPEFRTGRNAAVVLSAVAELGIVAAGMTLVIATGGIDISVGSVAGLSGVVLGMLCVGRHWSIWTACVAAVCAGAGCGLVNGLLIARFALPPIIATLATFSAARAGAYLLSGSASISGLPDRFINGVGYDNRFGVPVPAWMAAAALLGAGILLKKTALGRSLLALGGGRQAAFMSGVPNRRNEALVYVLSGLLAGVSAIVGTARAATAVPDAGRYMELSAITAVVMGGTPVTGGRATVLGTALGVLAIGVLTNGVRSYGRDDIWVQLVLGIVLLGAVEVERWRARRSATGTVAIGRMQV